MHVPPPFEGNQNNDGSLMLHMQTLGKICIFIVKGDDGDMFAYVFLDVLFLEQSCWSFCYYNTNIHEKNYKLLEQNCVCVCVCVLWEERGRDRE